MELEFEGTPQLESRPSYCMKQSTLEDGLLSAAGTPNTSRNLAAEWTSNRHEPERFRFSVLVSGARQPV